jgi:hypothetical protein
MEYKRKVGSTETQVLIMMIVVVVVISAISSVVSLLTLKAVCS